MTATPPSTETVRAALNCIPPDVPRDDRVRLAFAVFDALGDAGADLWRDWAGRRAKPDPAEDRSTWRSARKRGAAVGVRNFFAAFSSCSCTSRTK